MNEEAGFNLLLDQDINDNLTRTIYADWLQDRNDIRADGYRELGTKVYKPLLKTLHSRNRLLLFANRRNIQPLTDTQVWVWKKYLYGSYTQRYEHHELPENLWNLLINYTCKNHNSVYYGSRQAAEDAFAVAFYTYKLPLKKLLV
jgi:uncharacterized protein (TIGR02996 family)